MIRECHEMSAHPDDSVLPILIAKVGANLTPSRILMIGLLTRLALSPISGQADDIHCWYKTSQLLLQGFNPYCHSSPFPYPPMWLYMLIPVAVAYGKLSSLLHVHPLDARVFFGSFPTPIIVDWLFAFLAKLPIIFFDFATAVLIYKVIGDLTQDLKKSTVGMGLFFLNPYSIWISAVYGQFDVVPAFFLLLSLVFLVKKDPWKAALCMASSAALKFFSVLLVFPSILYFWRTSKKRSLGFLTGLVSSLFLFSLPFLVLNARAFFSFVSVPLATNYLGQLSILSVFRAFGICQAPASFIPLSNIITLSALIFFYVFLLRNQFLVSDGIWRMNRVFLLSILLFFLSFRQVNEQYLMWVLPFMVLDVVLDGSAFKHYMFMSLLALAYSISNIYFVSLFTPMLTITNSLLPLVQLLQPVPYAPPLQALFGTLFGVTEIFYVRKTLRPS